MVQENTGKQREKVYACIPVLDANFGVEDQRFAHPNRFSFSSRSRLASSSLGSSLATAAIFLM
jgi:hypothetical protein